MAGFTTLSLTEGELQTIVFGILEYRRALAISALRDEEATREPVVRVASLLVKIESAVQERLRKDAAKSETAVCGAQKLIDLAKETATTTEQIAREHDLCPACALDAVAKMLLLSASATNHVPTGTEINTVERASGEGVPLSPHKPGNA